MSRDFDGRSQYIDSRDVIAKVEELEADLETAKDVLAGFEEDEESSQSEIERCQGEIETLEEELEPFRALNEDGENTFGSAWHDGVTLIRDDCFEDYAEELAEDIGAISRDYDWPLNCIDWEKAARELQMDYSEVEFDGQTYWGRE